MRNRPDSLAFGCDLCEPGSDLSAGFQFFYRIRKSPTDPFVTFLDPTLRSVMNTAARLVAGGYMLMEMQTFE